MVKTVFYLSQIQTYLKSIPLWIYQTYENI